MLFVKMAVNWDACGINNAENLKHGGVRYSFRYFRGGQVRYNGIYNRQQMPKVLLIGDSMPKFYDDKDGTWYLSRGAGLSI